MKVQWQVTDISLGAFVQIDETKELIEVESGKMIGIGDIQPKHSRVIHIWSNLDVARFHFTNLKHALRISADELDSVRLRFPVPHYLWTKYGQRGFIIFNTVTGVAVCIFILLATIWK
jgi:hypothetical protein